MPTIDIYYGKKIIHLTDHFEEYHIKFKDRAQLKDIVEKFLNGYYVEIYLYHNDIDDLFKNFKIFFNFIESAGGIVFNKYHQLLLIKKNGVWDLPKGKIDPGESPEETALREVAEECGLHSLTVVAQMPPTYHIFKRKDQYFLKKIYWFKMIYKGFAKPTPLRAENITEVRWVELDELDHIYSQMHPNLIPLISSLS